MQIRSVLSFIPFLLALLEAGAMRGQTIHGQTMPPLKPTEKTVYDTAYVKVYYEYSYRPDSMSAARKSGQTILLIGDKARGFMDYYDNTTDFVNDSLCAARRSPQEAFMALSRFMGKSTYSQPLVIDHSRNLVIMQMKSVNTYQYTQPMPELKWTLADADTTVCDVACKKATCRFGGREWTAWYAPSFPIAAGPYLFGGLPGLIFDIRDTKDNFHFSLNGLENLNAGAPVYLRSAKLIPLTRDKARKAVENVQSDIYRAFQLANPNVQFGPHGGDNGKRPYNPIELE